MPPFGFGDDQISIFAEIPDLVLPSKQSSYSFALPPPPSPPLPNDPPSFYSPQILMPGAFSEKKSW